MPSRPDRKPDRVVSRRAHRRKGVRVAEPRAEARRRTPLPHVDGDELLLGDPDEARALAELFRVDEDERDLPIRGVHGLHPYPARFHPAWARRILATLPPRKRVLDPFCGSGTVLVEASRSGRQSRGSDLNDVALRVAVHRTVRRDESFLRFYEDAAREVHDTSSQRRESRFGALAKGKPPYAPHVLAQLITLRDSIERVSAPSEVREALLMTGSGLLGKFASRPEQPAPDFSRRAVRDHFLRRAEEAVQAWREHAELVAPEMKDPDIRRADARRLPWKPETADVVISSPPYPGVYDYVREQEWRARWLGEADWLEPAARREIGKRGGSIERWERGLLEAIGQMVRSLRGDAPIYLVIGDGAVRGRAVRVRDLLGRIDELQGFPARPVAAVGQTRPHFHGPSRPAFQDEPRREFLVLLKRR